MKRKMSAETKAKIAAALSQIPEKEIRAAVRELLDLAEEGQRTLDDLKRLYRMAKEKGAEHVTTNPLHRRGKTIN